MADNAVIEAMKTRFRAGLKTRVLAFGSSNTEHFLPGMHWFDVFELAIRNTYGRPHTCINTGIGGHTSSDLLLRFEDDAAFFQPHLVFITIGGNDSNPVRNLSEQQFERNLIELHRRFSSMGCAVVFQTYYAPDPARNGDLRPFYAYMDALRRVAAETKAGLIDHLKRWEPFRKAHPDRYLPLMHDGFHVNHRGNTVMGVDIGRHFGAPVAPDPSGLWDEALAIQQRMDALQESH